MEQQRAEALIVLGDPFFSLQAPRIAELAAQHRLPTMFWTRAPVESGGLMSYGQNNAEHYHRAATYIDKIFNGAKPGDLGRGGQVPIRGYCNQLRMRSDFSACSLRSAA